MASEIRCSGCDVHIVPLNVCHCVREKVGYHLVVNLGDFPDSVNQITPHPDSGAMKFKRGKLVCRSCEQNIGNIQNNVQVQPYRQRDVGLLKVADVRFAIDGEVFSIRKVKAIGEAARLELDRSARVTSELVREIGIPAGAAQPKKWKQAPPPLPTTPHKQVAAQLWELLNEEGELPGTQLPDKYLKRFGNPFPRYADKKMRQVLVELIGAHLSTKCAIEMRARCNTAAPSLWVVKKHAGASASEGAAGESLDTSYSSIEEQMNDAVAAHDYVKAGELQVKLQALKDQTPRLRMAQEIQTAAKEDDFVKAGKKLQAQLKTTGNSPTPKVAPVQPKMPRRMPAEAPNTRKPQRHCHAFATGVCRHGTGCKLAHIVVDPQASQDWTCSSCTASVFASRDVCYKCGAPKNKDAPTVQGAQGEGGSTIQDITQSKSGTTTQSSTSVSYTHLTLPTKRIV
eukprot:TRINITY_DN23493_c0_g1_i2.p1 TRINITY_DN23493_c0_g1~~TRINITY_DN23493_c0_g1_i2.p1  ORF type:complete len:455 (+),score=42.90 TRINITY_DN23493_c0_g1_i2:197-1561(+)